MDEVKNLFGWFRRFTVTERLRHYHEAEQSDRLSGPDLDDPSDDRDQTAAPRQDAAAGRNGAADGSRLLPDANAPGERERRSGGDLEQSQCSGGADRSSEGYGSLDSGDSSNCERQVTTYSTENITQPMEGTMSTPETTAAAPAATPNTATQVANAVMQDAPIAASVGAAVSMATGNPVIAVDAQVADILATAIAKVVLQTQSPQPVTQAEWMAMGHALGASLAAYNAAK